MDPVQKMWMFENWLADQTDKMELAKNHAYLVGSFINPEAVKQLLNDNVYQSTDEEYEESLDMVRKANVKKPSEKKQSSGRKRRNRKIKG